MAETTTAITTHTYEKPGKYLVLLTVTDDKDNSDSNWEDLAPIDVSKPDQAAPIRDAANSTAPYAVAAVDNDAVVSDTVVGFDGSSSAAWSFFPSVYLKPIYVDTLTWDFGDGSAPVVGNISAVGALNHTYVGDGVFYVAKLTVKSLKAAAPTSDYLMTIAVYPKDFDKGGNVLNPDTFVSVTIGDPRSLDPAFCYDTAGGEIIQATYETLIYYDGDSASVLKPVLATEVPTIANGGISNNNLTYTFKIRPDVKFHDGNVMTPEDVAYSMQRVLVMNHPAGPAWIIGQVLIPDYWGYHQIPMDLINDSVSYDNDAMTVTFHLTQEYPGFLYCLAFTVGSVVEKSYVEDNQVDTFGARNAYMDRHVMGTGAFTLVKWASKQYIQMDRFDQYWQGPAPMKHILIKQIASQATREMLLFSGDADSVYVDPQFRNDVRGHDDIFRIVEGKPTFNVDFIGLTQDIQPGGPAIGDIPDTFFSDMHVRNAFVYAFDYERYTMDIMQNTSVQPNGVIPIGMFGYDESVPKYVYNQTKVIEELKLSIDTRSGAAPGSSYWDNGFEIYLYYNDGNNARRDGCLMIKESLENASKDGAPIKVNVAAMEWTSFLDANDAGQLPMLYIGWAPDYADPDDYVLPFLYSSGLYGGPLGINDPVLDVMILEASMEGNLTTRAQMYSDISMYCYEHAFYLWTSQATSFHVERDWVGGYYYNPMYSGFGSLYYQFTKG